MAVSLAKATEVLWAGECSQRGWGGGGEEVAAEGQSPFLALPPWFSPTCPVSCPTRLS